MRSAFNHKTVHVKRHLLHEYKNVARYSSESLRSYINRYQRTECSLKAAGVDVTFTYDTESRGSRLLDRSKLSHDQQRLGVVSANQKVFWFTGDFAQLLVRFFSARLCQVPV